MADQNLSVVRFGKQLSLQYVATGPNTPVRVQMLQYPNITWYSRF